MTVEVVHREPAYLLMAAVQAIFDHAHGKGLSSGDDVAQKGRGLAAENRVQVALPVHETAIVVTEREYPKDDMLTFYPFGGSPSPTVRHYIQVRTRLAPLCSRFSFNQFTHSTPQAVVPVAYDLDWGQVYGALGAIGALSSVETVRNTPVQVLNATIPPEPLVEYLEAASRSLRQNRVTGAHVSSIAADAGMERVGALYAARASAAPPRALPGAHGAWIAALAAIWALRCTAR